MLGKGIKKGIKLKEGGSSGAGLGGSRLCSGPASPTHYPNLLTSTGKQCCSLDSGERTVKWTTGE